MNSEADLTLADAKNRLRQALATEITPPLLKVVRAVPFISKLPFFWQSVVYMLIILLLFFIIVPVFMRENWTSYLPLAIIGAAILGLLPQIGVMVDQTYKTVNEMADTLLYSEQVVKLENTVRFIFASKIQSIVAITAAVILLPVLWSFGPLIPLWAKILGTPFAAVAFYFAGLGIWGAASYAFLTSTYANIGETIWTTLTPATSRIVKKISDLGFLLNVYESIAVSLFTITTFLVPLFPWGDKSEGFRTLRLYLVLFNIGFVFICWVLPQIFIRVIVSSKKDQMLREMESRITKLTQSGALVDKPELVRTYQEVHDIIQESPDSLFDLKRLGQLFTTLVSPITLFVFQIKDYVGAFLAITWPKLLP